MPTGHPLAIGTILDNMRPHTIDVCPSAEVLSQHPGFERGSLWVQLEQMDLSSVTFALFSGTIQSSTHTEDEPHVLIFGILDYSLNNGLPSHSCINYISCDASNIHEYRSLLAVFFPSVTNIYAH